MSNLINLKVMEKKINFINPNEQDFLSISKHSEEIRSLIIEIRPLLSNDNVPIKVISVVIDYIHRTNLEIIKKCDNLLNLPF